MKRTRVSLFAAIAVLLGLLAPLATPPAPAGAYPIEGTYKDYPIENCADPTVIKVEATTPTYYMYCTADPLHDKDKTRGGGWNFHLMAILKSTDLITWEYVGDVFSRRPRWVAPNAGLWAPDIQYFNGKYYLYYSAAGTIGGGRYGQDSAIGVATASSPAGPWTDSGGPVVEKQAGRWVIDPFVILDPANQTRYIFYGNFAGGLSARPLSTDGLRSDKTQEKQIAVADRYEAPFIVRRNGFYYLFASATNCCNVGLTAYSVFVGRSETLLGPYLDREKVSLLDSRVGGTPVLSMNGNLYVGPGHNAVINDGTRDWFVYHAVNRQTPNFSGSSSYTKRPAMVDPLDWIDAGGDIGVWPVVRRGLGPSETVQQSGDPSESPKDDSPGTLLPALSDAFDGERTSGWSWAQNREPATGTSGLRKLEDGTTTFYLYTQDADLWKDRDNASARVEATPAGDYVVETRVRLPVAPDGTNHNYVQAGLVIYGDDDNYIKLVHVAIGVTRQTEFAKEIVNAPQYGNGVVGPPADWTYLRIVKRTDPANGEEEYTAYTTSQVDLISGQPRSWVRGATWTHNLGANAQIGLVAMGGTGYIADFDYVHVSTVKP